MRRLLFVPVLSLLAALSLTSAADASGGTYPSNAPTLTPGVMVSGGGTNIQSGDYHNAGKSGVEYYRVPLGFGDTLILDVTHVTGDWGTDFCVLDPGVTDYTIANANCISDHPTTPTSNKAELTYVAPAAGSYLVEVSGGSDWCCYSWAYQMTAFVAHPSTLSAASPKATVKVGKKIKITGFLSPAGGTVTLQRSAHGWQTVGTATTSASGAYKFVYRASAAGLYKFRVLYGGGNGYLPSTSGKVKVRAG